MAGASAGEFRQRRVDSEHSPSFGVSSGEVAGERVHAWRMRHLGIGRARRGTPVLLLIHDREVITSHTTTGEVIAWHVVDPAKNDQPKKSEPPPGAHTHAPRATENEPMKKS